MDILLEECQLSFLKQKILTVNYEAGLASRAMKQMGCPHNQSMLKKSELISVICIVKPCNLHLISHLAFVFNLSKEGMKGPPKTALKIEWVLTKCWSDLIAMIRRTLKELTHPAHSQAGPSAGEGQQGERWHRSPPAATHAGTPQELPVPSSGHRPCVSNLPRPAPLPPRSCLVTGSGGLHRAERRLLGPEAKGPLPGSRRRPSGG